MKKQDILQKINNNDYCFIKVTITGSVDSYFEINKNDLINKINLVTEDIINVVTRSNNNQLFLDFQNNELLQGIQNRLDNYRIELEENELKYSDKKIDKLLNKMQELEDLILHYSDH